jgi:hypothetical protein
MQSATAKKTRTTLPHRQSIDDDDDAGRGDVQTRFPFLRRGFAICLTTSSLSSVLFTSLVVDREKMSTAPKKQSEIAHLKIHLVIGVLLDSGA